MQRLLFLLMLIFTFNIYANPPKKSAVSKDKDHLKSETFSGLAFRSIGPALTSGRISDFAVNPKNPANYFVAVASGGVWKTVNAGVIWEPVFDTQGSYSIGCVTLDPNNPHTVWVGTGENNSQRSVGYGDGVYKSLDGGKSWKNMGLKNSEHIGMIVVDPRNANVVYVAAQGPLWSAGGDRGLYKTTDGGKTWQRVLEIDENTGVNEVLFDPRNPDVLYASAYQRRRHVWTLIDGGPGSTIYKSEDAGQSWRKIESGLPSGKMGRIGMAVSPANPDVLYAIVEAETDKGGFFRSTDRGESWEKRSSYVSGSPQYYNELFCDPYNVERIYSMDTFLQVSEDGGKTWHGVNEYYKHVDNHALWIDPQNTDHLRVGCDGGIYETWDRGDNWHFKANLPVTQYYKVSVDNDTPFYNIYGGTQDNFSMGGPSRTTSVHGIMNSDWWITLGGDGFETVIDPEDPNIVYSQYQYGGLARFDRRSGQRVYIQPQPGKDDPPLKWNWDAALIISPHSHTRLYYGANILFRSDDRGDTWRAVSPDLTRQIDRNKLPVMGKVWSVDAVAKNKSTSFYGTIVALSESPLQEGLIYAGTDDGLVQITENGGESWRKVARISGMPDMTYVNALFASQHDPNVVYGAFNNHKKGDFKPYIFRSSDRGKTWKSISANLPKRGSTYSIAEDHVNPNLLFCGTEFGIFFTLDGGQKWVQLKNGVPTVAVRDIAIQQRENDLVLGTFGRGFYVLDDYSPLRSLTVAELEKPQLFAVKKTLLYIPDNRMGMSGKSFQGEAFYTAPNPPFGAIFTYYLAESIETLKAQRQEKEKKIAESGGAISYPSYDELRAEQREENPEIILTVNDEEGNVIRRLSGPAKKGFHRIAWDLRYPPADPVSLKAPDKTNPFVDEPMGPLVIPGKYSVAMAKRAGGKTTPIGTPQTFEIVPLGLATLAATDRAEVLKFQRKTARLQRAIEGAQRASGEAQKRIDHIKKALIATPDANPAMFDRVRDIERRLKDLLIVLNGDPVPASISEPRKPGISQRLGDIFGHWGSESEPTTTQRESYRIAAEEFRDVLAKMRQLIEGDLTKLENDMELAGAPWTPGRLPVWEEK